MKLSKTPAPADHRNPPRLSEPARPAALPNQANWSQPMSLPRQIRPATGAVIREVQAPLSGLQERYRVAKNEYDATRGGERNSYTKDQRRQAKTRFEAARDAVKAGLAEDKKRRKSGRPEAAMETSPLPLPYPARRAAEATGGTGPVHPPGNGNLAGFGTRYQEFPVFRGQETRPFLETNSRWE